MPRRNPPDKFSGASSIRLAARLWRDYLGRYRAKLALALAAMGVYALSAAAIPAGVEWINARLSGETPTIAGLPQDVGLWGPLVIVALGLANALAQYLQARLSASAALLSLRDLQNDMTAKLVAIDDAQLRAIGQGQSIGRLTNGVAVLRETLTRVLTAIRDLMTLAALCAVMVWYDWALFAVVILIYAIIGWPVARIGAHLRTASRDAQKQLGDIAAATGEIVSGGRMIRAYNLQDHVGAQNRMNFDRRLETLQRMARLRALNEPFIFFVGAVALSVVIAVVAVRISSGALNVPQFVSFIIALLMLSQPARGLSTLNAVAQEGFGALEEMLHLVDLTPTIADKPGAKELSVASGAISFRDVSFSYDGAVRALDGFTLDIPAGASAALVGESGAGKSTVFNLLLRLYEPDAGSIAIDGENIETATLLSLRDNIAIVSQEGVLFNDTLAANIAFGRPGATREDIVEAAKAAAADEFIRALPQGYDSIVGEGGANLSGGQRQRIAIARAFLKDAPILLLDEATSALDAESEKAVQEALARLTKGRTTIAIAHRLATIRGADIIVAMSKGRVVESGRHEALLAEGGYYSKVSRLQGAAVIVE
ncbi:MAG: ABC transporter ATP-binding protein [Parvularculaceae bacterium]|nr:ABC transporter ATP-binding protein [Parvularculaceae bacterium]